jgi:V-type H+-transporting ATPase subunit a
LGLFGPTGWLPPNPQDEKEICPPVDGNQQYTTQDVGYVYPFGVDPSWKGVSNEILFYNSLKMKMSIILGVTHMTLGIVLSCYNHVYFHKRAQGSTREYLYAILFEFIPQLIILLGIFGYMSFIIVYKWTVNWTQMQCECIPSPEFDGMDCSDWEAPNKFFAPRLLNTMIDMFLSPGKVPIADTLFWAPTQHLVQVTMLLLVLFSIPVMLLTKPLLLRWDHKKKTVGWWWWWWWCVYEYVFMYMCACI